MVKMRQTRYLRLITQLYALTPRCRTLKVPKVGAFSPYLRVTTFWGFEIYTQKCMTLRDFDNFLFFP